MTTRTIDWDEFACDGQKCGCHDPFLCSTCGCLQNEAEPAGAGLREAAEAIVDYWFRVNAPEDRTLRDCFLTLRAALAATPVGEDA
jgi:hypothetical protein